MSSNLESAAAPQTVDEARHAVERSRQRISTTLDQLEEKIVEKKHELQDRADVLRPVKDQIRERPFTAVAVGLGVGALLGSLGGADDERESRRGRGADSAMTDEERRELREWRRHRRERLEARLGATAARNGRSSRDHHDSSDPGRLDAMKNQLMGAITSAIGAAVTAKVKEYAGMRPAPSRMASRSDSRDDARGI